MGPISLEWSAKQYLQENQIPQMFESLTAALMMEKPEDHVNYLDIKLDEIKDKGIDKVRWDTFVHHLHPLRAATRKAVIAEELSDRKRREDMAQYPDTPDVPDSMDEYQPDLFRLTEPQQ